MSAYQRPTAPGTPILSFLAGLLRRPATGTEDAREREETAPEPGPDGQRVGGTLAGLAREVEERIGRPVDRWAVAVALEVNGWRDVDARRTHGCHDVFALADQVYPLCRKGQAEGRLSLRHDRLGRRAARRLRRVVQGISQGISVSLPIVGQVAVVLVLGYSLWAWMYFTEAEATVVALGTLGSFVVTGGFVQCIGREGHRYLSMEAPQQAREACSRIRFLGLATVLVLALTALLVDALFPFYPLPLMYVSLMYFLLLSSLWLVLSILYVLKRYLAIAVFTLGGVIPVYGVMEFTEWGIYVAHAAGLLATIGMSAIYGDLVLDRKVGDQETRYGEREPWLPPVAVEFHDLLPYFLYGLALFAFLFVDRVVAWSVTVGGPSPYVIWFRTPYELGIDWALIPLLFVFAVLHHTTREFSDWTSPSHRRLSALPISAAVSQFRALYHRHLAVLLIAGAASAAGVYLAVVRIVGAGWIPVLTSVVADPVTNRVYWWATAGYVMASVGLYNVLLFFALGRPWFALRSLGLGFAVNVVAGLIASRLLGFEYAAVGLVAGSLVFLGLSSHYARQMLGNFAYYRYSAL